MSAETTLWVFAAALVAVIATGLGALPFMVGRHEAWRWLGPANGIASGVMLGASAGLIYEGVQRSGTRTALGAFVGGAFVPRLPCHQPAQRAGPRQPPWRRRTEGAAYRRDHDGALSGGVPAFVFVDRFATVLPVALGFAAGAIVWMVGRDLLPEALSQGPRRTVLVDRRSRSP
jgi:zinc transporter ZupT